MKPYVAPLFFALGLMGCAAEKVPAEHGATGKKKVGNLYCPAFTQIAVIRSKADQPHRETAGALNAWQSDPVRHCEPEQLFRTVYRLVTLGLFLC